MKLILDEIWINKHLYIIDVGGEILIQFQAYDDDLYNYWDYIIEIKTVWSDYGKECTKYKKVTSNYNIVDRYLSNISIIFDFPNEEELFYFKLKFS